MRKMSLQIVEQLAAQDERVCFIGSDLGFGVMKDFPAPERLFREGVSEQHIIGMAAGMALDGKIVYINTIASFLTRRCYEQIYLDLCLTKAKVRLLASGGGLVYAPLGPTHLAPDDLAILRPLPNMTILSPCDEQEMRALMLQTLDIDGPVYVRFAKGYDAIVSKPDTPWEIGKAVDMTPKNQSQVGPYDVLIITTGIMAQVALETISHLKTKGISARLLHCPTIKPLDTEQIEQYAGQAQKIVTLEEHILTGGLGSAVSELFIDKHITTPLIRLALPDRFFCEHGSQNEILNKYGLSVSGVEEKIAGLFLRPDVQE